MKIYLRENVWDASLTRIRWLFSEFPNVVVGFSGGKDSTVILGLSLIVAQEMGRLPLRVAFIDQEFEWQAVIDFIRATFNDPRIAPMWFQVPLTIENSASTLEPHLHPWEPGKKWVRDKEPNSLQVDKYGTRDFYKLFPAILEKEFPNEKTAYLSGMRAEESTRRMAALTWQETYKGVTYGNALNKEREHYTFYPIYDWSYTDVWHAIEVNRWPYCPIYDVLYQWGENPVSMRVSSLHHSTAVQSLFYLSEIEPDTWRRIIERCPALNTAATLKEDLRKAPKELPFMFTTWHEYRDYLLKNLIPDVKLNAKLANAFRRMDRRYEGARCQERVVRPQISAILTADEDLAKVKNFDNSPEAIGFRLFQRGIQRENQTKNRLIHG